MTADTDGTGPAGTAMIEVTGIDTPALGDRSYLATDGQVAMVVDPQRDIDRVLAAAASRGVRITHVFETHIHNDYVSGGLALARVTGAAYHVNAADAVTFDRVPVREGDILGVGDAMTVRVLATPGHTFTHLSYVLRDAAAGRVAAVFTGGSLLYGSTGRPDLLGPAHRATLAAAQYASAGRLASELPDDTPVWPTHGFGSFCTASPGTAALGTAALGTASRTPPPGHGTGVHDRPGETGQPGAAARRARVRDGTAGRPGRLSGVLRPHGPGQRGRGGPHRPGTARRGQPRPGGGAHRAANGSWTCAAAARSPPGTSPGRSASSTAPTSPTISAG